MQKTLNKTIAYKNLTDEGTIEALKAEGVPQKYIDPFNDFYIDNLLDESIIYPTVQDILHSPLTYEQWVKRHEILF